MLKTSDAFGYCSLFNGAFGSAPADWWVASRVLERRLQSMSMSTFRRSIVVLLLLVEQWANTCRGAENAAYISQFWSWRIPQGVLSLILSLSFQTQDLNLQLRSREGPRVFFFFLQSTVHILVLSVWGADPQFKVWGHFSPEKVMDCPMQGAICC